MSVRELLSGLNDRQRQAVETTKGPCLILAGPGSGKTRVVTSRICYLLEKGVSPKEILAITFTKKAAEEMRERVASILGNLPSGLTICTFHSLGFRMLRENHELAGLEEKFDIIAERKQQELMSSICSKLDDDADADEVRREISRLKNIGRTPDEHASEYYDEPSEFQEFVVEAYREYEAALREKNVVDLDDLIFRTLREVLQPNPKVAAKYARRYSYIMVDEYQDTNGTQFDLTKCILPSRRNLCVVGDDDQSIYGFRGSDVEHILNFADDFPGTRLIKLETNYRSSPQIVDVAKEVIERSKKRFPKQLAAHQHGGSPVDWRSFGEQDEEEEFISSELGRMDSYDDVAILFRGHEDAARIRGHLAEKGIPVRGRNVKSGVELLTLHAAKGLEFDTVFIPKVEKHNIPHSNGSPEEERRLFYVGLTRAKRNLYLTTCKSRKDREVEPSQFLMELDDNGGNLQRPFFA